MNPLHVLGVCELRDEDHALPRRDTVQFFGGVAVTDSPRRTVIRPGAEATGQAVVGMNTPPASLTTDPDGTKHYVYDELAGQWFGRSKAFSGTNIFYMRTEVVDGDTISLQGFAPSPISPRKLLVNLGPAVVTVEGRGAGTSPGRVMGASVKLTPNTSVRLFWDQLDKAWRLIQAPEWREQNRNYLRIQGQNLILTGWPLYIPIPDPVRR